MKPWPFKLGQWIIVTSVDQRGGYGPPFYDVGYHGKVNGVREDELSVNIQTTFRGKPQGPFNQVAIPKHQVRHL